MENIKVIIPDMQSPHCQMKVKDAINTLFQVNIVETKLGEMILHIEHKLINELRAAIVAAGYKVTSIEILD